MWLFKKKPNLVFSEEQVQASDILVGFGLPMPPRAWWTQFPLRAAEEIYLMQENTNAKVFASENTLLWQETITTNFDNTFQFLIRAEDFPFKMPTVLLQSPKIKKPSSRFHMYSNHTLCLMHSNDYTSKTRILDIRNAAAAWCFCFEVYQNTGNWPGAERHH